MLILESHTQYLYHATSIHAADEILSSGIFRLSTSKGTVSDDRFSELYFLSTARGKDNRFFKQLGTHGVIINLNGTKLSERYKIKPVDYWNEPGMSEQEDRILSNKPTIPANSSNILEIHIRVPSRSQSNLQRKIRSLILNSKKQNIPVFLYDNDQSFIYQIRKNSLSISDWLKAPYEKEPPIYSSRHKTNWLKPYIELYFHNDKKKLSKSAKRVLERLVYHKQDFINLLNADLHNMKNSEDVDKLLKIWRYEKIKTSKEFMKFLEDKWDDL